MAWWALEKITADTSALRGRCTFNQFFTPPLTTSHTHTHTHLHTHKYCLPCNQIRDAIELRSEIELRLEIRRYWLVLGKVQYMMLSYWVHHLITLVQNYRAAKEFRCDLMGLYVIPIPPCSTAALCLPLSSPFLLLTDSHYLSAHTDTHTHVTFLPNVSLCLRPVCHY